MPMVQTLQSLLMGFGAIPRGGSVPTHVERATSRWGHSDDWRNFPIRCDVCQSLGWKLLKGFGTRCSQSSLNLVHVADDPAAATALGAPSHDSISALMAFTPRRAEPMRSWLPGTHNSAPFSFMFHRQSTSFCNQPISPSGFSVTTSRCHNFEIVQHVRELHSHCFAPSIVASHLRR